MAHTVSILHYLMTYPKQYKTIGFRTRANIRLHQHSLSLLPKVTLKQRKL